MKKNLILIVVIFSLLFLYEWSADAATRIVYKSGASPCKIGDTYHNSIQAAVDMTTFNNNEYQPGDTIIVCPGLYNENVSIVAFEFQGHDWFNLTLRSYTQNTSDPLNPSKNAIIQAPAGSKKNTIYLRAWLDGITISGFTITGANGAAPCQDGGYDNDPKSADYYPQPCAGIRVYCVENQSFNPGKIINNVFTGNNAGIVIKDTSYAWWFHFRVENNEFFNNNVGVQLIFGNFSYILNNYIHDNKNINGTGIGIKLSDTWRNVVADNTIQSNDLGIEITSNKFGAGLATAANKLYHNKIANNTVQVYDNYPAILEPLPVSACSFPCATENWTCHICTVCPDIDNDGWLECQHFWYDPNLLQGNDWSNYRGLDNGSGGRIAGDGIGDTLIPFPAANYDNYPFADADGDLIPDINDVCPQDALNDVDEDMVCGNVDNCQSISNPDQTDTDGDGMGNACDADDDNDSIADSEDNCPITSNYNQADADSDYIGDACDACPQKKPVLRGGYYFSVLQNAYNGAANGEIIKTHGAVTLYQDITMENTTSIILNGGYDCTFTAGAGETRLRGNMRISNGIVRVTDGRFRVANQ